MLSETAKAFVVAGLVFAIAVNIYKRGGTVWVKSTVDGRRYKVLNRTDNLQAANILATLNKNLTQLVQHVYAKYPTDKDFASLYDKYRPESLAEGAFDSKQTSYSINKGERIVLCMRQSNGDFVDMNTLLYVAIHELAHVMTPTIGHDKSFWDNMQRLVRHATDVKLYEYIDYSKQPTRYCGIDITSSV